MPAYEDKGTIASTSAPEPCSKGKPVSVMPTSPPPQSPPILQMPVVNVVSQLPPQPQCPPILQMPVVNVVSQLPPQPQWSPIPQTPAMNVIPPVPPAAPPSQPPGPPILQLPLMNGTAPPPPPPPPWPPPPQGPPIPPMPVMNRIAPAAGPPAIWPPAMRGPAMRPTAGTFRRASISEIKDRRFTPPQRQQLKGKASPTRVLRGDIPVIPPLPPPFGPRRAYSYSPVQTKEIFKHFIAKGASWGWPVGFLRVVGDWFEFEAKKGDATEGVETGSTRLVEFSETVVHAMEISNPAGSLVGSAIQVVYHESTHAYLDFMASQPGYGLMLQRLKVYYWNAPLQGGGRDLFPDRLFSEAAAGYVGARAGAWADAYMKLSQAVNQPGAAGIINDARKEYNRVMRDRVYGYTERGFTLWTDQLYTTKPISAELKSLLDHDLLEDKVLDDFDSVPVFRALLAKIAASRRTP
jgi:hypothetical protein